MKTTKIRTKVEKLPHAVLAGDWHDRPLKWQVTTNTGERQLQATKADALLYARIRRTATSEVEAINTFVSMI